MNFEAYQKLIVRQITMIKMKGKQMWPSMSFTTTMTRLNFLHLLVNSKDERHQKFQPTFYKKHHYRIKLIEFNLWSDKSFAFRFNSRSSKALWITVTGSNLRKILFYIIMLSLPRKLEFTLSMVSTIEDLETKSKFTWIEAIVWVIQDLSLGDLI